MRADCVIAVDLNNDILNGRDLGGAALPLPATARPRARARRRPAPRAAGPVLLANPLHPQADVLITGPSLADQVAPAAAPPTLRRNGKPWPRWLQPAPGFEDRVGDVHIANVHPGDVRVPPAPSARVPSMLSSIAQSIDIMQVRITRSRLAGEPADVLIQPRLGGLGIFD